MKSVVMSLSLSVEMWLYLYIIAISISVEWCVENPTYSSIASYNNPYNNT